MSESVQHLLGRLRCEWNQDAFRIDVRLLHRKCKELAHQQMKTAKRLKQPCDVTPAKLVALYKRQRGRCAISGVPMTWTPGLRHPTSINLDHIEDIRRDESLDSVSQGGVSVGGQAGMMSNIRFICQAMHYIRYKLEEVTADFGDLRARLAIQLEAGPPCNDGICVDSCESFVTSREDVERAIDDITDCGKKRLSAKSVCQRLTMASVDHSYTHVLEYLQHCYGCSPKEVEQRDRVLVAAKLLHENPHLVDRMRASGKTRGWFRLIDKHYLPLICCRGGQEVTDTARHEDLCVAYQVVTGKQPPSTESRSSNSCLYMRNKLKHWSRPSPATRAKVLDVIKSSGRDGVTRHDVAKVICNCDELASLLAESSYATMISDGVMQIVDDLQNRRLIDVTGDVCVARLLLADAAKYCGLTKMTLGKYHKTQLGPVCELATAGNGRMLSFSFCELDRWLSCRPNRRDCVRAIESMPTRHANLVTNGLLFDCEGYPNGR